MADQPFAESVTGENLAPVSELQDYGASIVAELDKAEAELEDPENQPFSGISTEVMKDIADLRERQFDMFRRHVEIEQAYKIQNAVRDGNDVQRMTFSGIATTMRKKESATAGLLGKLEEFDNQMRTVIDKFENKAADDRHVRSNHPQQSSNVNSAEGGYSTTTTSDKGDA